MNIHLITTPNIEKSEIDNVCALLSKEKGGLKFFSIGSFLNSEMLRHTDSIFSHVNENSSLEFNDFFKYCNLYRTFEPEKKADIVVFITNTQNNDGYFSAVDGNNVFVYTGYFQRVDDEAPIQYAIAHNILVNVFQSLLGINEGEESSYPNIIHQHTIGCINDFCSKRSQIIIKLRTGYICDTCLDYATELGINNDIIIQIYLLLKELRENFTNFDRIKDRLKPEDLRITNQGSIFVGDKELKLSITQKTLIIYFASQPCGQKISEIRIAVFNRIYQIVRFYSLKKAECSSVEAAIREDAFITSITPDRFKFHKNKLNACLKEQIGPYKSHYYQLNSVNEITNSGRFKTYKAPHKEVVINNDFIILQLL